MIEGVVNSAFDAVVNLVIRGSSGRAREIEAVIDTGYNGFLTLPPALVSELGLDYWGRGRAFLADGAMVNFSVHRVVIEWEGRPRYIRADATGNRPLIGMSLLDQCNLYVEVTEGGRVVIQAQG